MFRGKVAVADGHLNALVTHQFLHRPNINPCHNQAAGEGMPQAMSGKVPDFSFSNSGLKPEAWRGHRRACRFDLPPLFCTNHNVSSGEVVKVFGSRTTGVGGRRQSRRGELFWRLIPQRAVRALPVVVLPPGFDLLPRFLC